MNKNDSKALSSGRRKQAIARASITKAVIPGKGVVRINGVPKEKLLPELARMKIEELFLIINDERVKDFNIDVECVGGGRMGQIDAARIAIARAVTRNLDKKTLIQAIREYDRSLLSGDSRRVEPKKWGGRKARKRFQKSFR